MKTVFALLIALVFATSAQAQYRHFAPYHQHPYVQPYYTQPYYPSYGYYGYYPNYGYSPYYYQQQAAYQNYWRMMALQQQYLNNLQNAYYNSLPNPSTQTGYYQNLYRYWYGY